MENPLAGFVSNVVAIQYSSDAEAWMVADLAKSGLTPNDIDAELCAPLAGTRYCYKIWYHDFEGLRTRKFTIKKDNLDPKEKKYKLPSRNEIGDDVDLPYIPRGFACNTGILDITEGEKKAEAMRKHGLDAIAIGGATFWADPRNKDMPHPWILEAARSAKAIRLWPDGDFKTNLNVQMGFGSLGRALQHSYPDIEVQIVQLPGTKKIDDLLLEIPFDTILRQISYIKPQDVKFKPSELVKAVPNLDYAKSQDEDSPPGIYATESNFAKILRTLPFFKGRIWFNRDRLTLMLDDEPWRPGLDDADLLEKFQSILGFTRSGARGNKATMGPLMIAVKQVALENERRPFRDWLQSLHWDGVPRLETWTLDYCHAEDTLASREWGVKSLLAAIGRQFHPGCDCRIFSLMSGPQSVGKSGLPRAIFGAENTCTFSDANSAGKDGLQLMASFHNINFDEFDGIKSERGKEELKSMITLTSIDCRFPYTPTTVKVPLTCTFWGSSNQSQILKTDASGYSRYGILQIAQRINFAGLAQVREQLWAEAMHLYVGGNILWSEWEHQTSNTQQYQIESPLVHWIRQYLVEEVGGDRKLPLGGGERIGQTLVVHGAGELWINFHEILQWLQHKEIIDGRQVGAQANLKTVLSSMGFVYSNNGLRRGGVNARPIWFLPREYYHLLP